MIAEVAWHDAECGTYRADLPVWRALAARAGSPVLDVGAGTGRVALDLAARGAEVVALDREPVLLSALRERAAALGVAVRTVVGDAEALPFPDDAFPLVLVPMQTVQLLTDRAAFLREAARVLRPGGLLALAIADDLATFEPEDGPLPEPDVVEAAGWRFESQPLAVRVRDGRSTIERLRTTRAPDGARSSERNTIDLALLDPPGLVAEAAAAGLWAEPGERIGPTDDHVGSAVVLLRA